MIQTRDMAGVLAGLLLIVCTVAGNASDLADTISFLEKHDFESEARAVKNGKRTCGSETCVACVSAALRADILWDKWYAVIQKDDERTKKQKHEHIDPEACRNLFGGLDTIKVWAERASKSCPRGVNPYLREKAESVNVKANAVRKSLGDGTLNSCIKDWDDYRAGKK